MIDVTKLSEVQIQKTGYKILVQNMGITGFSKFIRQFDTGSGDYTKEKEQDLKDYTVDSILQEIGYKDK